jgi:hypothetical protein
VKAKRLEAEIQHEVRLVLGTQSGCVWWRNNVGQAEFVSPEGRVSRVRYGLSEGSSDLIGLVAVPITQAMVGNVIGRFCALELKAPGASTAKDRAEKQRMFRDLVNRMGGYAEVVNDPQQALPALNRARRL